MGFPTTVQLLSIQHKTALHFLFCYLSLTSIHPFLLHLFSYSTLLAAEKEKLLHNLEYRILGNTQKLYYEPKEGCLLPYIRTHKFRLKWSTKLYNKQNKAVYRNKLILSLMPYKHAMSLRIYVFL